MYTGLGNVQSSSTGDLELPDSVFAGMFGMVERLKAEAERARELAEQDARADAEGRPRPSLSDPSYTIKLGPEILTSSAAPADMPILIAGPASPAPTATGSPPEGFAERLATGKLGDYAAAVGLPRVWGSYIFGIGTAAFLAWSIRGGR